MSDKFHQTFGPGNFCKVQQATFEAQEAERNGGDCPWCGRPVGEL